MVRIPNQQTNLNQTPTTSYESYLKKNTVTRTTVAGSKTTTTHHHIPTKREIERLKLQKTICIWLCFLKSQCVSFREVIFNNYISNRSMRREWLYKASGGVDGGSGGRSPSTPVAKATNRKKTKNKNTSGCMSVIFNLFDVQHHQFRFHHPSFISPESTISPESAMNIAPVSSKVKEETNLKLPMGKIQIKTKRTTFTDELSECSSSPGTKTPNLVARLMGLDILPEYSSPRPSSSSTPSTSHHRTRSLPTTPRMSTISRRSTDTDHHHHHHHRLSLQIDKENRYNNNNNNMTPRRSDIMVNRQVDDLKSQYAKQITTQVRERISRRLGTDITNTVSPATSNDRRRDSDLVLLKPKKSPAVKLPKPVKDEKIKRIASERYDLRLKNTTKKKSTALTKHVLNVKNTTKVGCCKREMTSSSSTARSSQLKVSLPSKLNSSYKDVTRKPTTSTVTSAAKGGSILQRLIEGDMGRSTRRLLATAYATEAEDIVKVIENEIMENLVHEIATETVAPAGRVVGEVS